ncbi:uncharacterized protein LOC125256687 isoform X1 [Megalobrama amblycephala]|uniref:uncharacterized protein LOC125256687 isoform X1 n=2 Tax=Megalobrama amblycephala TaxID=75352 RepID=UPI002013D9C0|nr:uncharacterized protein LOC125256687 isoform X1 [Megalobrama amblycephala]
MTCLHQSERMAHLYTSLVLLCFLCSVWPDVMFHFTHLGTKCEEPCKRVGHEYKCESTDKDGNVQSMYCSPKTKTDYRGFECGECGTGGKGYYYCKTGSLFSLYLPWGYCGLVTDKNIYYGSRTGVMCHDKCDQDKNYLCNTAKGQDLCSQFLNKDNMNRHCKEDSPCRKRGQNYYWCWLKEGSWGHCGPVEPKMFLHRSKKDHLCVDECQYHESGDYYWCHTDSSWDYCSPDVDVTYKNKPCRSDHSCGLHGESYNWCWTSESDYDYCGPVVSGECTYDTSQNRNRGDLKNRKLICTQVDRAKTIITTFNVEPAPNDIADGSQWKREAEILIKRWDNEYLVGHGHSNLIHSYNVHIDMKDNIKRNNQSYYDLRIHLKQGPGRSPTVSQIIVPPGIPDRYMRRAFLESFRHRARVFVDVSIQN